MRTQEVVLGDRSYPVHIGSGLLSRAGELLANIVGRRAIVITNAIVAAHHLAPLRNSLASIARSRLMRPWRTSFEASSVARP